MSQQVQRMRAEIATEMSPDYSVGVEVEGAELEQLERMSVGDGLAFLLAKCNGHPTARHLREILRKPYPDIKINGRHAAKQSDRFGKFLRPEPGHSGGEGDQGPRRIEALQILLSEEQSGG